MQKIRNLKGCGEVICVRCGQQNPDGVHFCSTCNSPVPKLSSFVAPPLPPRISNHYNQLIEICKNVKAGTISHEEFHATLNKIFTTIEERAREIETMEIPEHLIAKLQEQMDIGFSGINNFLDGIQEMALFLEDGNEEHLNAGLELAEQGNESLNAALDIARTNISRLKETDPDSFNPLV